MKYLVWLPVACLLGLLIGSWGPKAEIRSLRRQAEEARKTTKPSMTGGFGSFANMVNIPEVASQRHHARKTPARAGAGEATNTAAEAEGPQTNADTVATLSLGTNASVTVKASPDSEKMSPQDLRARIDEAKELWKTRVNIARATWVSRLKLTEQETRQFDSAIDAMNARLYDNMQDVANLLANETEMTPEIGLKLVSNLTTAMATTYDELRAGLPAAKQEEVAKMELQDFIDPGVGEPLIAVQGKLENLNGMGSK
jgi:hypothetical protein